MSKVLHVVPSGPPHEPNSIKMEAIINGVTCIKGEISSIMTLMRLNTRWSGQAGAGRRSDGYHDEDPLVLAFRRLNMYLEGIYDMREVDSVVYLLPFHQVIVSDTASGPLTQAALSSLSKFALYGFLSPQFPRMQAGVSLVAKCISNCIFEETDWESDEVIFMKLLELSALTMRCDASSLLSVGAAWDIYSTCLNIHAQPRASKILRSEAETALRDLTLTAFSRAVTKDRQTHQVMHSYGSESDVIDKESSISSPKYDDDDLLDALRAEGDELLDLPLWREASVQLFFSSTHGVKALLCKIMNTLSCKMDLTAKRQTTEDVTFALSLMNIALEAGGPSLGPLRSLVSIMRADVCRHLLRASQSDDLGVLSLSLRVVFNLFVSIKDHMKVQLEVFLTSVHLRLLRQDTQSTTYTKDTTGKLQALNMAREELALESLLEFCREPSLMVDLYTNYDCDVTCTNLFHSIIDSLCTRAFMPTEFGSTDPAAGSRRGVDGAQDITRLHILNRLALDGVFAVLHAVAVRVIDINVLDDLNRDRSASSPVSAGSQNNFGVNKNSLAGPGLVPSRLLKPVRSESGDSLVTVHLQRDSSTDVDDAADRWIETPPSPTGEADGSFLDQSAMLDQSLDVSLLPQPDSPGTSVHATEEAQAHARVRDAEVLRQRKLYKQQLRLIADTFNDRPLKPDWLKLAVSKKMVEPACAEEVEIHVKEDATMATAFALAVEKGARPPVRVEKSDRALSAVANARSVALFLKNTYGLGKSQVGEFISKGPAEAYPFHQLVLREYVRSFTFPPGYGFAESMRAFLGHFRMPGEAQCIDRLLEAFAAHLFEILGKGNPFNSADAVFILAFSTIMLNTDLHNPRHNKGHKKMTLEEFLRNNRDINAGEALPPAYITTLYNDIKDRQIQLDVGIQDDDAVDISGMSDAMSWKALLHKSAADQAPAVFTSTWDARQSRSLNSRHRRFHPPSVQDRDMFLVMAEPVLEAIQNVWNSSHGVDDALIGKLVSGAADYASICVSLGLRQLLTMLVEMLSNTVKALLEQPSHLAELMRVGEDNATAKRLLALLGPGFESIMNRQNSVRTGVTVFSEDADEDALGLGDQPWEGARLVRGELALRVLFHIVEAHAEALDRQAWAALLHLLLWIRQRGSLPPVLAQLQDNMSFWEGRDRDVLAEHYASVENEDLVKPSLSSHHQSGFARACHRRARGQRDPGAGGAGKGLISAFTGILFGSVTLTERADGVKLDNQTLVLDGNSCTKNRMDSHALLSRISLVKTSLLHGRAGLLILGPKPTQQSLAASRADVTLIDALLDTLEDRLDAIMFNVRKAAAAAAATSISGSSAPSREVGLHGRVSNAESDVDFGYGSVAGSNSTENLNMNADATGVSRAADLAQELEGTLLIEWTAGLVLERLRSDAEARAQCSAANNLSTSPAAGKGTLAALTAPAQYSEYSRAHTAAHWVRLRGIFLRIFEYQVCDTYPYLVERITGFIMRASMILLPTQTNASDASPSPDDGTLWECLRHISALPSRFVSHIAQNLGSSAAMLISRSVRADAMDASARSFAATAVQWHSLLSLLSAATAGPAGRAPAWEGICLILDYRTLSPVSFASCRVLLLRFLYGAFADGEDDVRTSEPNIFLQPAMDRLTGLCAMLLGGRLWARQEQQTIEQQTIEQKSAPSPARPATDADDQTKAGRSGSFNDPTWHFKLSSSRAGRMVTFQLPRVGGQERSTEALKSSRSTPGTSMPTTPVQEGFATNTGSANASGRRATPPSQARTPSQLSNEYAPTLTPSNAEQKQGSPTNSPDNNTMKSVYNVCLGPGGYELTVPAVSLPQAETEQVWLDTVRRLSEQAGSGGKTMGSAAVYNLQAVLGFGRVAAFSTDTWVSAFHSLVSRLPLLLARTLPDSHSYDPSSGQPTELRAAGHCLHSCNAIFELLVTHIVRLRGSQGLQQPWLRFCRVLAENVSLVLLQKYICIIRLSTCCVPSQFYLLTPTIFFLYFVTSYPDTPCAKPWQLTGDHA